MSTVALWQGETVNQLNEWLDTRLLLTRAFDQPSDEERERPAVLALLARAAGARAHRHASVRGIGAAARSGLRASVSRPSTNASTASATSREALAHDGALILKFWMHLSAPAQEGSGLKKPERGPAAEMAGHGPRLGSTGACTRASSPLPGRR